MQHQFKACFLMWFLSCFLLGSSFAQNTDSAPPVRAGLKFLDEKTTADLFGKQTGREFYAMRVSLFNTLDQHLDSRLQGKSILVDGKSMRALVGLEVKEKTWRELLPTEYDAMPKERDAVDKARRPNGFHFSPYTLEKMMIPSLKKSNAQLQNIIAMTMRPLEVIPYGGQISRIIFFPKAPLQGMRKDQLIRINRIDTNYFNLTVTILENNTEISNAVG